MTSIILYSPQSVKVVRFEIDNKISDFRKPKQTVGEYLDV